MVLACLALVRMLYFVYDLRWRLIVEVLLRIHPLTFFTLLGPAKRKREKTTNGTYVLGFGLGAIFCL